MRIEIYKVLHGTAFQWWLTGIMVYELAAYASYDRLPTITKLDKRTKHALAAVILGVLTAHFATS
jgi:hypothetical protein